LKVGQNRRGNLTVTVPRTGRTWIFLASSIASIGFAAAWFFMRFPDTARAGVALLVGLLILLIVWALLPASTVEFDVRRGVVLKPYFVELRIGQGPALLLGYTRDQVDASILAAHVGGAIDRPVRVAGA
jgi:predicted RND superfamily exporter protein